MDVGCLPLPLPKPSAKDDLYSSYTRFAQQQVQETNEQGWQDLQDTPSIQPKAKKTKTYSFAEDDQEKDYIPSDQAFQARIVHVFEFIPFNRAINHVKHSDLVLLTKAAEKRNIKISTMVQRILDVHDSPDISGNSLHIPSEDVAYEQELQARWEEEEERRQEEEEAKPEEAQGNIVRVDPFRN